MRKAVSLSMIVGGLALMILSYFVFSAPWGVDSVDNSDPRVPFGATLFVVGVVIAFLSAVVYELLPSRTGGQSAHAGRARLTRSQRRVAKSREFEAKR